MHKDTGSFFFSIFEQHNPLSEIYSKSAAAKFIHYYNDHLLHLAQHAQSHVDGGQQGSKRRRHIGVKRWSRKAEHKQSSVFGQIHTLTPKRRQKPAGQLERCL